MTRYRIHLLLKHGISMSSQHPTWIPWPGCKATSAVVDASDVTRWAETALEGRAHPPNVDEELLPNVQVILPFSVREDLNRKVVCIW